MPFFFCIIWSSFSSMMIAIAVWATKTNWKAQIKHDKHTADEKAWNKKIQLQSCRSKNDDSGTPPGPFIHTQKKVTHSLTQKICLLHFLVTTHVLIFSWFALYLYIPCQMCVWHQANSIAIHFVGHIKAS